MEHQYPTLETITARLAGPITQQLGKLSSGGVSSAPVYVDHDWCASYCYDLNQAGGSI